MWKIEFWLRAATDIRGMNVEFQSSGPYRAVKNLVQ